MGILDWLRKIFLPRPAVVKKEAEKEGIPESPEPITLVLEPIPTSTSMLVYEGDRVSLPGYKWFSICYFTGGYSRTLAVSIHPKGGFTGAYPYSFKYTVEVPELGLRGEGQCSKYYDPKENMVKEELIDPIFTIPKVFPEGEGEPIRILPKSYRVEVAWPEFTIESVYYPPFVGGDGKLHPAIVPAGRYTKLQVLEVLPAFSKPWFRK